MHTEHTLTHANGCGPVTVQVLHPHTAVHCQRGSVCTSPEAHTRSHRALLSPAHAGSTHGSAAHRQPHMRTHIGSCPCERRAPCMHSHTLTQTLTHAFSTSPACQERFILQLGVRRQWAPGRTLQTDSAAGTDTLPIPPKSPSLPPAHLHPTP